MPVGRVEDVEHRGFKRLEIGQAQAWYYPADRALVLWECFLDERSRTGDDPLEDQAFSLTWQEFERRLLAKLPWPERIYTTREDIYERPVWQRLLGAHGHAPVEGSPAAFAKMLVPRIPLAGGGPQSFVL